MPSLGPVLSRKDSSFNIRESMFSSMKSLLNPMCLVQLCWTGLFLLLIDLLPQWNTAKSLRNKKVTIAGEQEQQNHDYDKLFSCEGAFTIQKKL
jgi:hypothetical protein